MPKVNVVRKKDYFSLEKIVKYQLLTHCFINNMQLSNSELDCLTLLAKNEVNELSGFCDYAVAEGIFKTSQTVRNFLTKAVNLNLVTKEGTNKKIISLHSSLQIQCSGNVLLDFSFAYVAKE